MTRSFLNRFCVAVPLQGFAAAGFALAFAALATTAARAEEKPLKVFICGGQSNMVGKRSLLRDTPEELKEAQANLFFDKAEGSWVPLKPGASEPQGYGPEITFARAMAKALGEPVGIIKHSQGGTGLRVMWNPARSNGKSSPVPGKLYKELLEQVQKAKATRPVEIVGMIWMQGEQDAKNESDASAYGEHLKALITHARKDFGAPDMAFVAGRITPMDERFPYVEVVRKAQENCDTPRYGWIDCDALPKGPDGVHYSTGGIILMGESFAAAMEKLLLPRSAGSSNQSP